MTVPAHYGASNQQHLEESQPVPGVKLVPHSHHARTLPLSHRGSYTEPYHLVSLFHINICKHGAEQGQCFGEGAKGPSKPVKSRQETWYQAENPLRHVSVMSPALVHLPPWSHRPREERNPNKATNRPLRLLRES